MKWWIFILALIPTAIFSFEESLISEKSYVRPLREVSVIVTDEGYYPSNIHAYVGEKVQLFLTTLTKAPSCLVIEDKKVFMGGHKGEMSEATLSFDRPGEFKFYCPAGKIKGRITVLEKERDRKARIKRELASKDQLMKAWRPKDL